MVKLNLSALGLLALPVASALGPSNLVRAGLFGIKMIPQVNLHGQLGIFGRLKLLLDLQRATNIGVVQFGGNVSPLFDNIVGHKKKDAFNYGDDDLCTAQAAAVNYAFKLGNPEDPDSCPGYLYYGTNDFVKNLELFCQNNPFFANALTLSDDGEFYELLAYNGEREKKDDGRFMKFMRKMDKEGQEFHRINVRFTKDFKIDQITTYDKRDRKTVQPRNQWDYYASGAIYNVAYYVSCVHATIHVLHYIATTAMKECSSGKIKEWSKPYTANIPIKYAEVALLLIASNLNESQAQILTGELGFGASKDIIPLLKDLLKDWGACRTAEDFLDLFLLSDLPKNERNNPLLLPEYKKHLALVDPFAADLRKAMEREDRRALDKCEKKLAKFMRKSGPLGVFEQIDGIIPWVSIMSCTGILHGSTLSYTRAMAIPEIMQWRDIEAKTWTAVDTALMANGLATISGTTLDRHVFTSEIKYGKKWNDGDKPQTGKKINDVLEEYEGKAQELKEANKLEVTARPDFREFGWILTDNCPDGFDGKQHTITTYI